MGTAPPPGFKLVDYTTPGPRDFDSGRAQCYNPADRERLLGIIESGFGTLAPFDRAITQLLTVERPSPVHNIAHDGSSEGQHDHDDPLLADSNGEWLMA